MDLDKIRTDSDDDKEAFDVMALWNSLPTHVRMEDTIA